MNKWTTTVIVCLFLLLAASAQAQRGPEQRRGRARTFLVLQIADALDLSDEKALQVSRILRESEGRRQDLNAERKRVERELRKALDGDDTAKAQLGKLIARANEIDEKLALVPERSVREVQAILMTEEQAKLVLFRPELKGQVRRELRQRLRGGREAPAGPSRFED
jgi:hypothetical protein